MITSQIKNGAKEQKQTLGEDHYRTGLWKLTIIVLIRTLPQNVVSPCQKIIDHTSYGYRLRLSTAHGNSNTASRLEGEGLEGVEQHVISQFILLITITLATLLITIAIAGSIIKMDMDILSIMEWMEPTKAHAWEKTLEIGQLKSGVM